MGECKECFTKCYPELDRKDSEIRELEKKVKLVEAQRDVFKEMYERASYDKLKLERYEKALKEIGFAIDGEWARCHAKNALNGLEKKRVSDD